MNDTDKTKEQLLDEVAKLRLLVAKLEKSKQKYKRMEQKLLKREAQYRLLAENATDVIWTRDLNLNLTFVSPSVERLMGYSVDEIMTQTLEEKMTLASLELVMKTLGKAMTRETQSKKRLSLHITVELEMKHKDGSAVWTEVTTNFIRDNESRAIGILGISRDITDRKRAEVALRESQAQIKALFENAVVGLFRVRFKDTRAVAVNAYAAKMFGYASCEEFLQKWRTKDHYVNKEDQSLIVKKLQGAGYIDNMQLHSKRLDGTIFWTEASFNLSSDRKYLEIVAIDITERKRAEAAMRESEERYRRLTENAQDMIWRIDANGTIQYVNKAVQSLLGISVEDSIGLKAMDYLSPGALKKICTWVAVDPASDPSQDRFRGEVEYIHRDGHKVPCELNASIIRDDHGNVVALEGITRDITDRIRAEEDMAALESQFQQAQKMESVGRLAGGVAHDFNNLLTGITGYTEMMQSTLNTGDPMFFDLEEVRMAAERAARLTGQLLAFSRKQIINPKVVDINETVKHSQKMLKRLIEEDIDLLFVPGKDLWRTKVDPGQLDQILVNLAVNARDAMPEGGKLTIKTANVAFDEEYCKRHARAKPDEFVMLAMSDNGCGMEKELLDNIFEPFFTTKEKGKGTGLGLSMVYGIVKQHGGFIDVYSEPGKGTSFKIYLPSVWEEADEIDGSATESDVTGMETVLVVEDNDMVRSLSKRILEKNEYNVLEAEHGGVASLKCEKYKGDIHLLLTDVVMPNMNGKDLYEQIVLSRPGIKVLYMSGYTDDAIAHRGVLDAGTAFIQKPFKTDYLLRKVREVLDAPDPGTAVKDAMPGDSI